MVKHPSRDVKKEITSTMQVAVDQRKHVVSHQQGMWELSVSALLKASNLLLSCCLWSPLPLQLFSLDSSILCIQSIFEVHSVWYDAMHSSVKPVKIPSCPRWFTYGKFSILATAWKLALIGYCLWPSKLKVSTVWPLYKMFPRIKMVLIMSG